MTQVSIGGIGGDLHVFSLLRRGCCVSNAAFFRVHCLYLLTCRKGMPFRIVQGAKSLAFEYFALVQGLHCTRVISKPSAVSGQLVGRQLQRLFQDDPIDTFGARGACD